MAVTQHYKENPVQKAIFRYNSVSSYTISEKKKLAQHYFDTAITEFDNAKQLFPLYNGLTLTIKHPHFSSSVNFLVYNFYTFLLLYSELGGKWSNFNKVIQEISFLLWDAGYGRLSYEMFTPVLDNPTWKKYYLSGCIYMKHNKKYHKKHSSIVTCPVCGCTISPINLKRHMEGKVCAELAAKNVKKGELPDI